MDFARYLDHEWRPSLGCTEPAAVAWAAACAAAQAGGPVRAVRLVCDAGLFKNCHAVGIPCSGGRTGTAWALAIGALIEDPAAGLEVFAGLDGEVLAAAERLVMDGAVDVEVDPDAAGLRMDCRVERAGGTGRAVVEGEHLGLVRLERDGRAVAVPASSGEADGGAELEAWLRGLSFPEAVAVARGLGDAGRARLRAGAEQNVATARHGLSLLPEAFVDEHVGGPLAVELACLVCAGVHARMSGAERTVVTLAGSGNKGITVSVPLAVLGEREGFGAERVDEALALACLVTSQVTRRIGMLSAMCGCANAAGLGLSCGLVLLRGGGERELAGAVRNMVGNVAGIVCDGAKPGCALKASTAVDAAFRAASLALSGFAVAAGDGIVAAEPGRSLDNLERVARRGLAALDPEILAILGDGA